MADARQQTHNASQIHGPDPACGLCGDVALEAEVLAVADGGASARVRAGGCEMEIATDLVEPVRSGDRLLVHLGFAIARLEAP